MDACPGAFTAAWAEVSAGPLPAVTVAITSDAGAVSAVVTFTDGGVRSFVDATGSCEAVAQAAALSVKLALERAAMRPLSVEVAPVPIVMRAPLQPGLTLVALPGLGVGILERPAFVSRLSLVVELPHRLSALIGASWHVPQGEFLVRLSLAHADAALCYEPLRHVVTIGLCGGASVGALIGWGVGVSAGRQAVQPWLALGPGVRISGVITRWLSWLAAADLLIAVTRHRFLIANFGDAFVSSPVGATFGAGLAWKIL